MKPTTPDALVRRYLRQLRAELAPLPADRRQEVLDQIGEHIAVRRSSIARTSARDARPAR
jgi:acyl-CoA reductase-like NAD-dependent aldehyde dehydrogenase